MSDKKQSLFDDEEEEGKFQSIKHLQSTPQHKSQLSNKPRTTSNQLSRSPTRTHRTKKMSTNRK